MPLKLGPINEQVEDMARSVTAEERREQLDKARKLLRAADAEKLKAKIRNRRNPFPWLVAVPTGTLSGAFPSPDPPRDFSAVAADGSSIPTDRHSPVRFYVINTGHAVLTYGRHPNADLDSAGQLYFEEKDLYISPGRKNIPVEGTRLGMKMGMAELQALLAASRSASQPAVALRDGSLILWALQNEDEEVQHRFLGEFKACLEEFQTSRIPVVGYVSYTGSHDLANTLRVWLCQDDPSDCDACSLSKENRTLCSFLSTTLDRQLFDGLLQDGERSDVFESRSAILDRYGDHRIQFFYMDVGGEIARIEAPQWVMRDAEMLELMQAVIYDQCQRSGGYPPYPPALQEAHEQAVIGTAERRLVEDLVEQALAERGIVYARSAKAYSKRRRGV
ncbi:MAG: DNA double-strand break repair nuclease NurA [Anaerolineales bacterium]|nr:MAG: DNA double-strand break repair nuclease NurA [Anaerolineales bacterium]